MNRILMLMLVISSLMFGEPVVVARYPGLLGNTLFGYCAARVFAEEMGGWSVHARPIWGFPGTYGLLENMPSAELPTEVISAKAPHFREYFKAVKNKDPRNISFTGFFHGYKIFEKYADKIRNEWLKLAPELELPRNTTSVVVHVRAEYPDAYFLPFSYYEKALSMVEYDRVYICCDNPDHPYMRNFDRYDPIVVSTRNLTHTMNVEKRRWDDISKLNMDDFAFIMSFDKIIYGMSTYAWWAAFLSDAKEIYACDDPKYSYMKVGESRYHYIPVITGKR